MPVLLPSTFREICDTLQKLDTVWAIMLIGNSGSGKSTIAKMLSGLLKAPIVSTDEIRSMYAGNELDQTVNFMVWPEVYRRVASLSRQNKNLILDATNVKYTDRMETLTILKEYYPKVLAVFLDIPLEECLRRNSIRTVPRPDYALSVMDEYLQGTRYVQKNGMYFLSTEPELAEGFDLFWRLTEVD